MNRLQRIYFETSALNAIAEGRDAQDAVATKALQNLKGRGLYLSPVVLWELMLTSDKIKREALILFAQHLFEPDLLPSPEELIVNYVISGCPAIESEYPLISKGSFSAAWRDICLIKEKTLIFDEQLLRDKTSILRDSARLFHEFTSFNAIDISAKPGIAGLQVSIQQVLDRHAVIPAALREDPEAVRHLRLVAFFVVLVFCMGASIDQVVVENFWLTVGARTMLERIDITFSSFRQLILRGPFHQIAHMANLQGANKFSRGVYFDSLHTVYSIYADMLISADEHFRTFRRCIGEFLPYTDKICHYDELQFTTTIRENPPAQSFLLRGAG